MVPIPFMYNNTNRLLKPAQLYAQVISNINGGKNFGESVSAYVSIDTFLSFIAVQFIANHIVQCIITYSNTFCKILCHLL